MKDSSLVLPPCPLSNLVHSKSLISLTQSILKLFSLLKLHYLKSNHSLLLKLPLYIVNSSPPLVIHLVLHLIISNSPLKVIPLPPKRNIIFLKDPVSINSGILPPILHPVKNPSQSYTRTGEFLRTHPKFKANLPSLYMTSALRDRNFDQYVTYASKNLEQVSFWQNKRIRFFRFQFNFLNSTQQEFEILTPTPMILPLLLP